PIPQSATDAIKWFDSCDISDDWGSGEQFASCVDAVIVGAHSATAPSEVKLLSTALCIAAVQESSSSSLSSHRVVVTPAGRDALVAMPKHANRLTTRWKPLRRH
ncbi:Hypothetical protein, putative, partial [Bodo saltans]